MNRLCRHRSLDENLAKRSIAVRGSDEYWARRIPYQVRPKEAKNHEERALQGGIQAVTEKKLL